MFDLDTGKLAVGFECYLVVTVNEELVESLRVACVGDAVQFDFDRGTAAAGWRGVEITQDTSGAEDYFFRSVKLHYGYLLAYAPEHL